MRKKRLIVLAAILLGGSCLAGGAALAAMRSNAWRENGAGFQLGYVVGYFDALTLAQRKDQRVLIPLPRGKDFDSWVREVNAFFENPENAQKTVPDALHAIGSRRRIEMIEAWKKEKKQRQSEPSPSPGNGP